MRKYALLLCVVLASCSTSDLLKGAAKVATGATDSGISADLQVGGKRENEVAVDAAVNKRSVALNNIQAHSVSVTEEKTNGKVGQAENVTINNNPTTLFWLIAIGLVGWLLPSPKQCWEKLKSTFKRIKEKYYG